jgi:hypothetical protein
MPRYVVERTFTDGVKLSAEAGEDEISLVVERNADQGVTWLQSYVSDDGGRMFCVYEGPTPEAIRKAAAVNSLPIDRITQIRVLDPYARL